jgi:hypothetical protein
MLVDLHEVRLQREVVKKIERKVAWGKSEWIPALEAAERELEKLKAGRITRPLLKTDSP